MTRKAFIGYSTRISVARESSRSRHRPNAFEFRVRRTPQLRHFAMYRNLVVGFVKRGTIPLNGAVRACETGDFGP